MDAKQLLERFEHETKWRWLHFRLVEEMPYEFIRRAVQESKLPRTRFILDDKLRKFMNLR